MNELKEFYETFPYPEYTRYTCACGRIDQGYRSTYNFHKNKRILIVGSGTTQAVLVARENPTCHITAIDLSSKSIEISKSLTKKEQLTNIVHIHGDVMNMNKEFDHIIASGVIHHIRDDKTFLLKLRSLLGNGTMLGMVYGTNERESINKTRQQLKHIPPTKKGVQIARTFLRSLKEDHPSRLWYERFDKGEQEIADTWLHPFIREYTIPSLTRSLKNAGFHLNYYQYKDWRINFEATCEGS